MYVALLHAAGQGAAEARLPSLRVAISGRAPMPAEVIDAFEPPAG